LIEFKFQEEKLMTQKKIIQNPSINYLTKQRMR